MKKEYTELAMEVIVFDAEDVIMTSGEDTIDGDGD